MNGEKAAEDSRTPSRFASFVSRTNYRQVLECGCPLPLWLHGPLDALTLPSLELRFSLRRLAQSEITAIPSLPISLPVAPSRPRASPLALSPAPLASSCALL